MIDYLGIKILFFNLHDVMKTVGGTKILEFLAQPSVLIT